MIKLHSNGVTKLYISCVSLMRFNMKFSTIKIMNLHYHWFCFTAKYNRSESFRQYNY